MASVINLGQFSLLVFLLIASSGITKLECTKFTIINNCNETIWPGIHPSNFSTGGFALRPNQSAVFTAPASWHGRIWARTGCTFDDKGNGTCETGGCGTSLQCTGPGRPPASIAEFSLGETDYYDVSLVDGFNLGVVVSPLDGKGGRCSPAGCKADLLPNCPPELVLRSGGRAVGCESACNKFEADEYCCRGAFSTPMACLPTNYSRVFKAACPAAYSFAYDDPTSIVTCSAADYMLAFCSSRNQTLSQCTYHDNKVICNGSGKLKMKKQVWRVWEKMLIMAILVVITAPILV